MQGFHNRFAVVNLMFVLTVMTTDTAFHQERRERTLDEIKTEAIHRAENGMYPLIGLDPADVREAFASIKTTDKDEWAAAFMAVTDRNMAQAEVLEATGPTKAKADYVPRWRLYPFCHWAIHASPGQPPATT